MELRHRRCFVVVAEAGSLTRGSRAQTAHVTTFVARQSWVLEDEVGPNCLTRGARGMELRPARRYVKLGFGGAHTDSNQRLMYTSA